MTTLAVAAAPAGHPTAIRVTVSALPAGTDHWQVQRRVGTDDTTAVTLAGAARLPTATAAWLDYTVESGVGYQYRAVAVTAGGVRTEGAWTA